MKKALIVIIVIIAVFCVAGALWWHELNVVPNITIPKPPPPPAHNAYDYVMAAHALDIDSNKATWANANRPPGYKDPEDPDDRYYTLAEKKALLGEYLPLVAKVEEGLRYPYVDPNPEALTASSAKVREVARMISFTANVYNQEGDGGRAMDSALDDIELGEKMTHAEDTMSILTGLSIEQMGFRRLWGAAGHLNAPQTASALARLERIDAGWLPPDRMIEQLGLSDQASLDRMLRQPNWRAGFTNQYNYKFSPPKTAYLWSNRAILENEIAYDNAWVKEMRKPYAARGLLPQVPGDAVHQWDNNEYYARNASTYGGQLNQTRMDIWFKNEFMKDQTNQMLLSLALHAYKLDHGHYPTSLSELSPAYLEAVPADPFAAGAPLHYGLKGKSYLLYSIGPDGVDDGGKPILQTLIIDGKAYPPPSHNMIDMSSKGDIVAGVNIY